MKTVVRTRDAGLHLEREEDEVTVDDLRVIIAQLKECWQMGDHRVMCEARTALLDVFHKSAKRLTKSYTRAKS